MVTCQVCGSEDFEKHAGFLYCAVCQVQSQDYHEQEYEFHNHEASTIRRKKAQDQPDKTKKQKLYDDGMWTSWEAFNFILFGMTEEMKKFQVTADFEKTVLQLWAAYLKECEVAFTSRSLEITPKLCFNFRNRDAQVLYNIDTSLYPFRDKKEKRSKSVTSRTSSSSSKRFAALQRGKIIKAEYQELMSTSFQSSSNLANETLESLGNSSDTAFASGASDSSVNLVGSFKQMLRKNDFKMFKSSYPSKKLEKSYKEKCKKDVKFPGKNKLLSIIHLALLMTGSEIQLSDLLRFIREGHLSFAKVTHFFPRNMKLPKCDSSYIEVTSDSMMPTHLRQRKISSQLAYSLKIEQIPTADIHKLIDRYCFDLNLPDKVAELSKKVLRNHIPMTVVPRVKRPLACFEAWAMVSIIFMLKLLFGLNNRTEIFLSQLAHEVNSLGERKPSLFVFEEWQKYIECRKSVLSVYHYPTQEQLNGSPLQSSKEFLDFMMKESKDEYRNERFIPYSDYYMEKGLLDGMKAILNELSKPLHSCALEFQPSLTPQTSHIETIMEDLLENQKQPSLPNEILKKNFKDCSIEFALDTKSYCESLKEKNLEVFNEFDINFDDSHSEELPKKNSNILLECSSNYWMLKYPNARSGQLENFKEEVFDKTPKNFQWLMTECARMLEMNIRDIYDELLYFEKKLS